MLDSVDRISIPRELSFLGDTFDGLDGGRSFAIGAGECPTAFSGALTLGEADYAPPDVQGYDVMKYVELQHLNAHT